MTTRLADSGAEFRRTLNLGLPLAAAGILAALAIGMAAGAPTVEHQVLAATIVGAIAIIASTIWPFAAIQVLFASSIFLVAWVVLYPRAINPIDVLMPPVLVAGALGAARREAKAEEAGEHPGIREATRRLVGSVWLFYGLAVASLVVLALRGHVGWAMDSGLNLSRAVQGLMYFALGLWWLRRESHLRAAERALLFGAWLLILANVYFVVILGKVARAGMTWVVNLPEWPITSPNEAAISLLIVLAIVLARPQGERGFWGTLFLFVAPIMLVLTQSRSGLLAWAAFWLLTARWWRWRTFLVSVLLVGLLAYLAPEAYWGRLNRTLALSGGSFEAFSSIIRIYGWQAALQAFLQHPFLGSGYLGFRFISSGYNNFGIIITTAENYYLETAVGMGVFGVAALIAALVALWKVGTAVRRATPPGSHGHELARRHGPLLGALLVVNLTGDQFMGLTGLSQLAIWTVLVVRAGQRSAVAPGTV